MIFKKSQIKLHTLRPSSLTHKGAIIDRLGNNSNEEVPASNINIARNKVWAENLIRHKVSENGLTDGDKIALPKFFKTTEQLHNLFSTIADEISQSDDASLITIYDELVTEITGLCNESST